MNGWREVDKEEFYQAVGGVDCHPHPVGNYPYTSLFETPSRRVVGKAEGYIPEGEALAKIRYWLPSEPEVDT